MPYQVQLRSLGDLAPSAPAFHIPAAAMQISMDSLPLFQLQANPAGAGPTASGGDAGAHCDCMLSAVPGLAAHPDQLAAGRTLCLQDPAAFEQQLNTAGWHPVCGGGVSSGSSGGGTGSVMDRARAFAGTIGGKVAIGLGVVAIIGVGVAVAKGKR